MGVKHNSVKQKFRQPEKLHRIDLAAQIAAERLRAIMGRPCIGKQRSRNAKTSGLRGKRKRFTPWTIAGVGPKGDMIVGLDVVARVIEGTP